jgi:hypothetical protein
MTITRLLLATSLSLAAIVPLSPASAQSVVIDRGYANDGYVDRDEDNTVVIRRHHDNGWHRGWENHAWRDREAFGMGGCRIVTIRRQNDMGDTIIKRMRRCD